jgi:hypothetical protein
MQVDGAGWHTASKLEIPENIRLIVQPASSPELNPVEHLWDDMRKKDFAHELHASLQEVKETLCAGIRRLAAMPEALRSMTFFPHLRETWRNMVEIMPCAI